MGTKRLLKLLHLTESLAVRCKAGDLKALRLRNRLYDRALRVKR